MLRLSCCAAVVLAAMTITACGGSGPGSAAGTGQVRATRGLPIAYARCMRAHGVSNFPDPGSSAGGGLQIQASQRAGSGKSLTVNGVPVNAPAFQSAMLHCQSLLPKGPPLTGARLQRMKAQALAMSRCMRSHGVPNFPDPQFTTGPGGRGFGVRIGGPGIDPSSPAFQSAQQACGSLLGGAPNKALSAARAVGG